VILHLQPVLDPVSRHQLFGKFGMVFLGL